MRVEKGERERERGGGGERKRNQVCSYIRGASIEG